MIELFSAAMGFVAPFLPEALKFFQRRQDNEHEIAILKMQVEKGAQEHLWRMDEIGAQSDANQIAGLYQPQQSFGVQMLDAAKGHKLSGWALYPAFYLFCAVDALAATVRPAITYAAFAFYMAVKWAELETARHGSTLSAALLNVWGPEDRAIVLLVLSYWFGHRAAKAAFGGSAQTSKAGA